jgi:hypothetical protein
MPQHTTLYDPPNHCLPKICLPKICHDSLAQPWSNRGGAPLQSRVGDHGDEMSFSRVQAHAPVEICSSVPLESFRTSGGDHAAAQAATNTTENSTITKQVRAEIQTSNRRKFHSIHLRNRNTAKQPPKIKSKPTH